MVGLVVDWVYAGAVVGASVPRQMTTVMRRVQERKTENGIHTYVSAVQSQGGEGIVYGGDAMASHLID